jgi:hypothetical protein
VRPRLVGEAKLVRYADDYVILFASEDDARRVFAVLPKRFERFGLRLHPEKTRLIDFRRPKRRSGSSAAGADRPESFDLLGFTHYWGQTQGKVWVVKHSTARSRFTRALRAVTEWCRDARHLPIRDQWKILSSKLQGHYAYYGISGNSRAISRFFCETQDAWRKQLDRRSRKAGMTWTRFRQLLARLPLPPPRIKVNLSDLAAKP